MNTEHVRVTSQKEKDLQRMVKNKYGNDFKSAMVH